MKIDASKQRFFPKYQDKKFKSESEFGRWLSATAKYKIAFVDNGQDALVWYIDEGGEVIHCEPFQSSIWNGKMVDLDNISVGMHVPVLDTENQQTITYNFVVENITKVTNRKS